MEFEYKELPDHLVEEISVIKKQMDDFLNDLLTKNDHRLFFSALLGSTVLCLLENFHDQPLVMQTCQRYFDKFFADYDAGVFNKVDNDHKY